ncbi:nicotinate-nucleotide--dimethylbenzimidazole phosphoribosyltransferase [Photobacterium damselae]|uniref:Nicotinate-nucleotide--dimethylbenzimidazole phosphoribosyltransferase n=1 Tax=Photobacterium damselae TaxID=38293 RepID=A0ABD6X2R6_PHODM|nr:nicotinate-nucleotide--dimethylbenzimidazole phosphoribosyltransferase [Photobacterium damselae]OBU38574.1 nicotinate-nucleotide--dimethylbenzimidazole phosphoribosyltransferase [Photobacterium damselae]PSU16799.1 nicotinate-nucleotide--dimethylbenzimidazole phosphoribosyltransferase [Photobacterium damselae]
MFSISAPDRSHIEQIQHKINNKTKPLGALGQLETLACQIALIQQSEQLTITQPHLVIFAGDHGITKHGVSIAPSDVTGQMVANFLAGGAAINCFCRSNNMDISVVDAGIKHEPETHPHLIKQRLGTGTHDFTATQAMSRTLVLEGIKLGASVCETLYQQGTNCIGFGEMGIGNTSSASAIMALALNLSAQECVGSGTGINSEQLAKKTALIEQAITLHKDHCHDAFDILAAVGGFEIVQMVGAILQAAQNKMIVLVDGFIATAAALMACQIHPDCRQYLVFCHQSQEQGHQKMLTHLAASPLLHLDLRLGEGTGAALALPLLHAACAFYNDMASFDDAGITV